jgi:hypothetical protein
MKPAAPAKSVSPELGNECLQIPAGRSDHCRHSTPAGPPKVTAILSRKTTYNIGKGKLAGSAGTPNFHLTSMLTFISMTTKYIWGTWRSDFLGNVVHRQLSALAATSTLGLGLAVLFAVFTVVLVIVGAVRGVLAPVSLWPSPAGGTQQVAAVFGVLPVILLAMVIHYQVHPLVRATD